MSATITWQPGVSVLGSHQLHLVYASVFNSGKQVLQQVLALHTVLLLISLWLIESVFFAQLVCVRILSGQRRFARLPNYVDLLEPNK